MSDIPLVVGTSTSLQEEIARLDALLIEVTRERDEARAEVERLQELHLHGCECAMEDACAFLRERDAARKALVSLTRREEGIAE